MQNKRVADGELRCCGRKAQNYKSKGFYYCHRCHHEYSYGGQDMGEFGSGRDVAYPRRPE